MDPGVEDVTQGLADDIEGECDEKNGDAREDYGVGRLMYVGSCFVNHESPVSSWRLGTEAEETKAGHNHDSASGAEGHLDNQETEDVPHNMAEQDPPV